MGLIINKIFLDDEPAKIWGFITNPNNFPRYVYGYAYGKTTSPNAKGIGASYEWCGKLGLFELKSTERIIEWKVRKRVAYAGKLFGIRFSSSMNLKKIKNQTQLMVSIKYAVPLYLGGVITDQLLIKWIAKDHIKKSLDNLRKIFNE